jgi:hypothetical protein
MNVPTNEFISVIPKGSIFEIIKVTEENINYISSYLKEKGCVNIPSEHRVGQIWMYDAEMQDCMSYPNEETFNSGCDWIKYG